MDNERASQEKPPGQDPNTTTDAPEPDKGSTSQNAQSLEELLEEVDRAELRSRQRSRSTTDTRRMKRCPSCGSVKVKRKLDKSLAQGKQRPEEYRCDGCHHHFNQPDNPPDDRDRRVELRRDSIDAVRGDAGVGDQREAASDGGCRHSDDALPCWDCITDNGDGR